MEKNNKGLSTETKKAINNNSGLIDYAGQTLVFPKLRFKIFIQLNITLLSLLNKNQKNKLRHILS